jgi:SAM-dependent methyltransferase
MKHFLEIAELYQAYQKMGGFFGARLKAFNDYLDFSKVRRVFDIGCGPGHISQYIPPHIEYIGFDTEPMYIDFANRRFGKRGKFVTRLFDKSAVEDYGRPDMILMNGVLHHMDDASVLAVAASAAESLTENGVFFTLDGCFAPGQNPISHYLLAHDRGEHVRDAPAYRDLVASAFSETKLFVRDDLSWVPYTFAILHATKPSRSAQ